MIYKMVVSWLTAAFVISMCIIVLSIMLRIAAEVVIPIILAVLSDLPFIRYLKRRENHEDENND